MRVKSLEFYKNLPKGYKRIILLLVLGMALLVGSLISNFDYNDWLVYFFYNFIFIGIPLSLISLFIILWILEGFSNTNDTINLPNQISAISNVKKSEIVETDTNVDTFSEFFKAELIKCIINHQKSGKVKSLTSHVVNISLHENEVLNYKDFNELEGLRIVFSEYVPFNIRDLKSWKHYINYEKLSQNKNIQIDSDIIQIFESELKQRSGLQDTLNDDLFKEKMKKLSSSEMILVLNELLPNLNLDKGLDIDLPF